MDKEERLRKLKNKSGSDVIINVNCEFLNSLKGNYKDYFYILDTIWNNNNVEYIAFSPKQAFNIYNRFNIYTRFHEIIIPLTEGYCKIVGNNKKENKKILFLNNSMTRVLYQINSTEKINKLLSWLKEILQIGGYIAEEKQNQSVEFITDNAKRTTECYINGELKGRAIASPKEEIDDRMGKLVSFIRALEFSKDTEKRLINNLFITEFITETELEDVTKLKEKNKELEKQRDILLNTNNKIKGKLCKTYLEVVELCLGYK